MNQDKYRQNRAASTWIGLMLLLALVGCGRNEDGPAQIQPDMNTAPDMIMDASGDLTAPLAPKIWQVAISKDAPDAVRASAQDVVDYLVRMGHLAKVVEDKEVLACVPGLGLVVFVGDGVGVLDFKNTTTTPQSWAVHEHICEGGRVVSLMGGGLLGRQYAAYEWLHMLGVRFFHPEQEYVPQQARWSQEPIHKEHTPAFEYRSVSLHLTHPLALGDAFRLKKPEYLPEAKRYIDWQLKNGASFGTTGYGSGDTARYGNQRGFPRSAGFSLHNQQQGGQAIIDPDDPRSEEDQIAEAIDNRMGNDPDDYPERFGFTFNPSEFTEIDDRDAVRQLTFIANYMAMKYPKTKIMVINHGTKGEPTEHYGVRYYDLPQFAPANLGVNIHTLMFYDLFRPAPVYGNENFNYLYDFMAEQYQTRELWYYPESAWWLTFDNAVPLYLPVTMEARDVDIQNLAYMLKGKLTGHRVFGSGHEWGYWQNEYCAYRMAADTTYRYTNCLADITSPMGEASQDVQRVLLDAIRYQQRDFIYNTETLRYMVGSDPETEIAQSIGIHFHALPPSPTQINAWTIEQVTSWENKVRPTLLRAETDYADLVRRLSLIKSLVPDDGLPWFNEILDGLELNGLRARHGHQVYGAAVMWRKASLTFNESLKTQAKQLLEDAKATTVLALDVVHRREQSYRYKPLSRYIAGGPDGDQDENWTIYKYRVHNRAHHGYYYTRPERLVQSLFESATDQVVLQDAILASGQDAVVEVLDQDWQDILVDFGDGTTTTDRYATHTYTVLGPHTITVTAKYDGKDVTSSLNIVVVPSEQYSGFTGDITKPDRVDLIEPIMPGIVLAPLSETEIVVGFSASESGNVDHTLWQILSLDPAFMNGISTKTSRFVVPVINKTTETVQTSIVIENGVFSQAMPTDPLTMNGQMDTNSVVQAMVAIGGFEEVGARRLVSRTLGFTPSTLPEQVPFTVFYTLP